MVELIRMQLVMFWDTLDRPGLFVANRGADRDPSRGPRRPRGTSKGAPAAKITHALVDFDRKKKQCLSPDSSLTPPLDSQEPE